jgi:predicted nucleotidyltransferase component of viral defense system
MLTYASLINDAVQRGMPANKARGILREYLQILILKELYRLPEGRKLFFTGGTYLRLIHHIRRSSEDLDFNAQAINETKFKSMLHKVEMALKQEGLDVKIKFRHWGKILVAELIFPTIEKFYAITSSYTAKEGIVIKIEVNRPQWEITAETLVVSGFGYLYPVICTEKGALFADKIDALLNKNRARHLFDIIFMLAHKYPINTGVLRTFGITQPPLELILQRVNAFSIQELKKQAESLRPFLFDESAADLITNAPLIVKQLIDQYQESAYK